MTEPTFIEQLFELMEILSIFTNPFGWFISQFIALITGTPG